MRTFSKAWGLPSLRLGFLVTNKKLRDYISKCRSLVETNALSFQIAMWALKNKYILNQHVNQIKKGSKFLTSVPKNSIFSTTYPICFLKYVWNGPFVISDSLII